MGYGDKDTIECKFNLAEDIGTGALALYDGIKRFGGLALRGLRDCIGILVEGEFNLNDFRALRKREVIYLKD